MLKGNKKSQPLDGMVQLEKQRKRISSLFIGLLIAQIVLFASIQQLGGDLFNRTDEIQNIRAEATDTFIKDTVREQQRKMLSAIRQGWVQYLNAHPQTELIVKSNGKHVYGDNKGNTVVYDESNMYKRDKPNAGFDIFDKETNKLIIENARPQWNRDEVKKILDIIASPIRAFGPSGDVLVYDAFTLEVLMNSSDANKDNDAVIGSDGRRYLSLEPNHPNNKNPKASQYNLDHNMWRRDTDRNSGIISFFNESEDMGTDGNNFVKYPLGQYDRDFYERIILPYESVGVEGQPMQIAVMLNSNEKELVAPYSDVAKKFDSLMQTMNSSNSRITLIPMISVALSLITVFFAMFALRINTLLCKKCSSHRKNDQP